MTDKQAPLTSAQKQAVYDAVTEALGDAYDCLRVWSAWGYGNMSENDFRLVAEDGDRVAEIADAAIAALSRAAPPDYAAMERESFGDPEKRTGVYASPAQPINPDAAMDDDAVDQFAAAMKKKMAQKRLQGRYGWYDKKRCSAEQLSDMLVEHVEKGDPTDVANFAMMLHWRGEKITLPAQPTAQASAEPEGYTDEWIAEQFRRTLFLRDEKDGITRVLRIFGNRVLMEFGDREGMHRAFSEAYERDKAERVSPVASAAPVVPTGDANLPADPTDAMQLAGAQAIRFDTTPINKIWTANAVWRAMRAAAIAAAPKVPTCE